MFEAGLVIYELCFAVIFQKSPERLDDDRAIAEQLQSLRLVHKPKTKESVDR